MNRSDGEYSTQSRESISGKWVEDLIREYAQEVYPWLEIEDIQIWNFREDGDTFHIDVGVRFKHEPQYIEIKFSNVSAV